MAQRVQVLLEDDLNGGAATQTVSFSIDGAAYEIDLNDENAAKFRDSFAVWIRAGRKAGRSSTGGAARRRPAANRRSGVQQEREWLIANGYEVSSRGRIPANLREIYDKAH
jgi:hypothetical protein